MFIRIECGGDLLSVLRWCLPIDPFGVHFCSLPRGHSVVFRYQQPNYQWNRRTPGREKPLETMAEEASLYLCVRPSVNAVRFRFRLHIRTFWPSRRCDFHDAATGSARALQEELAVRKNEPRVARTYGCGNRGA